MYEKLYSIKLPLDRERQELYVKGEYIQVHDTEIKLLSGQILDLGTYFNLFSLKKWRRYTTIHNLEIHLDLQGACKVTLLGINENKQHILHEELCQTGYQRKVDLTVINDSFITLKITALEDNVFFSGGYYSGEFLESNCINIGIVICTFKREKYLKRNLRTLQSLMKVNSHFHVMVIDNGQTLPEIKNDQLQLIHNRNYGGSGGFTRGLIEQVEQGQNDYVVLMDDDILIELSSLERVYALCCHRKKVYNEQMIAGSMMSMDEPTIQYENTAYWGKIRLHSLGQDFRLTDIGDLLKNDDLPQVKNKYAAWWFCCIPLAVVRKNGYSLPLFIKGDDMEFGIRNHQDIITMNGIGVWHEAFTKKLNPVVNYFSDRNMLILNEYATGCGRGTAVISLTGRLVRRILRGDTAGIRMLELAIRDYASGFEGITVMGADEKMEQVKKYKGHTNIIISIVTISLQIVKIFLHHNDLHNTYLSFRNEKLRTSHFWKEYLGIDS